MRAVLRAKRVAVVGWLALTLSGCMAWRLETASPREVLKDPGVHAVRIVSNDSAGTKVEIYDPVLVGDSISGHPTKTAVARIHVPLSHVSAIATRHQSFSKTLLAAGGVLAAIGAYAVLQSLNQGY